MSCSRAPEALRGDMHELLRPEARRQLNKPHTQKASSVYFIQQALNHAAQKINAVRNKDFKRRRIHQKCANSYRLTNPLQGRETNKHGYNYAKRRGQRLINDTR